MPLNIEVSLGKKAGLKEWLLFLFTGAILILILKGIIEEKVGGIESDLQIIKGKLVEVVRVEKLSAKVVLDNRKEILFSNIVDTLPFNWFRDHKIFHVKKDSLVESEVFIRNKNQLIVSGRSLKINGSVFYSLSDYQNDLNKTSYYKVGLLIFLPFLWIITILVFVFDLKVSGKSNHSKA